MSQVQILCRPPNVRSPQNDMLPGSRSCTPPGAVTPSGFSSLALGFVSRLLSKRWRLSKLLSAIAPFKDNQPCHQDHSARHKNPKSVHSSILSAVHAPGNSSSHSPALYHFLPRRSEDVAVLPSLIIDSPLAYEERRKNQRDQARSFARKRKSGAKYLAPAAINMIYSSLQPL